MTLQVIHNVEDLSGRPVDGGAAQRAEAGGPALRGGRLAAGGGAGDGVLPDQAEPQPERADRAAARPDRAADGEPAGLLDERGRRVRQGDRRHLRLRRGAGLRDRHDHPGGRRRAGRDQPPARRPARRSPTRCSSSSARSARRRSGTTASRPSWPSRCRRSRARRCTSTSRCSTRRPARTSSPTARGRRPRPSTASSPGSRSTSRRVVCMLAPYVNSYRRYVPNGSAPINLEWGPDNRTTGLRVPISEPEARRIENRVVGMDCNPYLALAASLACGYLGMKAKLKPRDPVAGEAYHRPRALPRDLLAALDLFDECPEVTEVLGVGVLQPLQGDQARRGRDLPAGDQPLGAGPPAAQRLRRWLRRQRLTRFSFDMERVWNAYGNRMASKRVRIGLLKGRPQGRTCQHPLLPRRRAEARRPEGIPNGDCYINAVTKLAARHASQP